MHSATLSASPRLRRTLAVLEEAGGWISTRALLRAADICAVNSVVAELRDNGCTIDCEQRVEGGERRWFYRLVEAPKGWRAKA